MRELNKIDALKEYAYLFHIDNLTEIIDKNINDFLKEDHADKREKRIAESISVYKKKSTNGNLKDRSIFKELLKTRLLTNLNLYEFEEEEGSEHRLRERPVIEEIQINKEDEAILDWIIPFNNPDKLTPKDKFEIMLYKEKEIDEQGYDKAFKKFIHKHSYRKKEASANGFENYRNEYSVEDINNFFSEENITLEYADKAYIITQRIYENLYGLKCIDILAYSDINEVGIGNDGKYIYAWCGEKIHLSFLQLTETETRIVQDAATSFDEKNPALTLGNPEVLCFRADNARVTAAMPNFSAAREMCIRIFNENKSGFTDIIKDQKQQVLLQTLLKIGLKTILQGPLGSGKTTAMKTFIEVIDDSLHIGTIEDILEQHNRLRNPQKRIVELQSVLNIENIKTLYDAMMLLFRLSVDVASVGEGRDGEAFVCYYQLAQAVNNSTLITTHIASPEDTIPRIKNLLIATGRYFTEQAAVADIVTYTNIICQTDTIDNQRCISKIVEVVPLIATAADFDINLSTDKETLEKLAYIQQIQQNTAYMYKLNYLMEYVDGEFKFINYPSKRLIEKAKKNSITGEYMETLLKLMEKDIGKPCERG